ncbi:fibropellin-3-like [Mytilus californianus]|uniref:fibropellin-3-like n=1 Tax=Mytilus californianus TaxID=6549 RepID=UPI002247911A|nr:fibropellin-3-like [Mytilus californianus]
MNAGKQDIDECASKPCQHESTCVDHTNDYSCVCTAGYSGIQCQTDTNECASDPCQHGGDCINLIDAYLCHCPLGYIGVNCQKDIDECISQPCQNGATCINLVSGFTCSCVDGYTGTNCETDLEAEESRETSNKFVNSKSETDDIGGCDCFIDHTGYDHFQRFDKRLKYKYRFHNCRNKKGFKKENPTISKTRTR